MRNELEIVGRNEGRPMTTTQPALLQSPPAALARPIALVTFDLDDCLWDSVEVSEPRTY